MSHSGPPGPKGPPGLTPMEIYLGSDGEATKSLYALLEMRGAIGVIGLNLFRAQKCSERAKGYGRRFKGDAYGRKQWSMDNLCQALEKHAEALGLRWGWKQDLTQEFHNWVLYVEIPTGQVSFHTAARGRGPEYPGDWDHVTGMCPQRIVSWVTKLLREDSL